VTTRAGPCLQGSCAKSLPEKGHVHRPVTKRVASGEHHSQRDEGDLAGPIAEASIAFLKDRQFSFSVSKHDRVFTNVAIMTSGLRRFLSYQGQALVNLDVKSAQPLILAGMLREQIGETGMTDDARLFEGLCESGTLYEHLVIKQGLVPTLESRNQVKEGLWPFLFGCNGMPCKIGPVFASEFPTVHAFVRDLKAEDHRRMVQAMQISLFEEFVGSVSPHDFRRGVKEGSPLVE
jgi:hypothetical protein